MQVKKAHLLIFVTLLLLGGAVATTFIMKTEAVDPALIEGLLWPEQKPVTAFELVDHNGETLTTNELKGQWSFLFFGYMNCPDICPTTLNILKEFETVLLQQYPQQAVDTRFIFVSVDGERDSLPALKKYTKAFSENFIGAGGTRQQVDSLARQLGIYHAKAQSQPDDTSYLINHSGSVLLMNTIPDLTAIFQPPHQLEDMLKRYIQIRKAISNK